jgi:predicted  nucleic acid-binding Zn-ribbon protein
MNENDLKVYNKGIQEGRKHSEPSNKTMEELTKIKENCSKRGTEMALMNQKLSNIERKLDEFLERMEDLEKNKADKSELDIVRGNIAWAIRVVVGAVILALLALIMKSQ